MLRKREEGDEGGVKRIGFWFTNWKTNKADFEGANNGDVNNAKKGEMSKTISWASIKRPTGYCIIRSMISIHKKSGETGKRMQK